MKFVTFGRVKKLRKCQNTRNMYIFAGTNVMIFGYLKNRIKGEGALEGGGLLIAVSTVDPDQVLQN